MSESDIDPEDVELIEGERDEADGQEEGEEAGANTAAKSQQTSEALRSDSIDGSGE